jgi:hypothetical protein
MDHTPLDRETGKTDIRENPVIDPVPVFEFNRYQGCYLAERIRRTACPGGHSVDFATPEGAWRVEHEELGNPADADVAGLLLRFRFTRLEGPCEEASAGVAFRLPAWSEEVHAFMPGALYQGNRFRSYPCGWYGCYAPEDAGPDPEQIVTRIPRLNRDKGGKSRVQLLTRDLATPAVGFWCPARKQAVLLLTDQGPDKGDTLIEIEESPEHDGAWVRFTLPGVREEAIHTLEGFQPSPDRGATFAIGESVTLNLTIHRFACADLREFHRVFFGIRKQGLPERLELPGLTLSRALELQHQPVAEHRWSDRHQLFVDEPAPPWYFQTGWTGGMMKDYPVYVTGTAADRTHVEAALRSYNTGWSPSGLMHGRFDISGVWTGDNAVPGFGPLANQPHMKDWTLTRRHGDVLFYLLKTARFIRREDPAWRAPDDFHQNLRRSADVLCRTFENHGQLGQYLDQVTGDIRLGGSTAAASVPSGLLMAWHEFGDTKYLETAKALAARLYERHAAHGNMNGTPADIMQSPDSEGPALLLDGMCDLFDATGDPQWLRMAEHCAWLLATWVCGYDYDFGRHFPHCEFHRLRLKTVGAIWASAQNRIGVPGLCVSSGLSLLRLYRATGDERLLELLRDIVHGLLRATSRPERPSHGEDGGMIPPGWIAERYSTTDVHMPGTFWKASTPWCQTAMLLTCLEIPSLHVLTDQGIVHAFDTIRVDDVRATGGVLRLTVTNPTSFPARYKVMAESTGDMTRPLPHFHFTRFKTCDFQPNETQVMCFAR